MRMLARNMQKLKYALQDGTRTIYEYDSEGNPQIAYTDEEGNVYYVEAGQVTNFTEPTEFLANIAQSGGEAEAKDFGLSIADYDATIVTANGYVPIEIGSVIWHTSEVKYTTELGKKYIDEKSADYIVIKVNRSLNYTKYVLKAVVK